ncbi:DUF892 family protein [Patulibacter brassicae]|uniref:DUF892 family protein n=1 Tax=Patulibacter brassicae TaxID=1705717 RepID=A0ABU4VKS5_9ACTN|nr:DUF892 family protein [Patulibacter brassicae]MDX8152442.1 DUF892 family protein [Patulibacter brassicae]
MTRTTQKIVQYLNEAHASEVALVRVLQSQIAMTPRGRYRTALEAHLEETRDHAERVRVRLRELEQGRNPVQLAVGVAESIAGQALALAKTPLDLVRGTGGAEKVLKNAKDAAATEALEIATYTALETLAEEAGDERTARLAASIRADEERMLRTIRETLPTLTRSVLRGTRGGRAFDPSTTGAGEAVGRVASAVAEGARDAAEAAEDALRRAPGAAQAEGVVRGTVAGADDLPIAGYDDLTVAELAERIPRLSPREIATIEAYERRHKDRRGVLQVTERELAGSSS